MNIIETLVRNAQQECQQLCDNQVGVLAVVIATTDGFDIASTTSRSISPERIAAMASSISAIGDVVSQETSLGKSTSVTVNTELGFNYITHITLDKKTCILNVVGDHNAILAQIIYQCNEIRKRLEQSSELSSY